MLFVALTLVLVLSFSSLPMLFIYFISVSRKSVTSKFIVMREFQVPFYIFKT